MTLTILEKRGAMNPGTAEGILSEISAAVRRNPGSWNRYYTFVNHKGKVFTPWEIRWPGYARRNAASACARGWLRLAGEKAPEEERRRAGQALEQAIPAELRRQGVDGYNDSLESAEEFTAWVERALAILENGGDKQA